MSLRKFVRKNFLSFLLKTSKFRCGNNRCHLKVFSERIITNNTNELSVREKLTQIFKTMTSKGKDNIRRWVDIIIHSRHKLAGQKSFARGLLGDSEAVENGISMHWSNGAVEGHINRIRVLNGRCMGGPALSCCGRR
jgi:transposase